MKRMTDVDGLEPIEWLNRIENWESDNLFWCFLSVFRYFWKDYYVFLEMGNNSLATALPLYVDVV